MPAFPRAHGAFPLKWYGDKASRIDSTVNSVLNLFFSKSLVEDQKCGGQDRLLYVPSFQYLNSAHAFQTHSSINTQTKILDACSPLVYSGDVQSLRL